MRIKTHFYWKEVIKTFCILLLVSIVLILLFLEFEIPKLIAVAVGVIVLMCFVYMSQYRVLDFTRLVVQCTAVALLAGAGIYTLRKQGKKNIKGNNFFFNFLLRKVK